MRSRRLATLTMLVLSALFMILAASGMATADTDDDDPTGDSASGWTGLIFLFCIGGVWLIGLVFWIWLLTWVYRDAQKRGMSGVLWVLLVLFLQIIGIIIYLIARDPVRPTQPTYYPPARERNRYCVKCKKNIPYDSWMCPYCGHDYRKK